MKDIVRYVVVAASVIGSVGAAECGNAQEVKIHFTGTEVIIEGTDLRDRISYGMTADRNTILLAAFTKHGNYYREGPSVEVPAYNREGGGTRKIRFNGRNGKDEFRPMIKDVGRFQRVTPYQHDVAGFPPCELFGGDGADEFYGSSHDDLIVGGNGNDNLFCGPGSDIVWPGHGNDNVLSGNETDVAVGIRVGYGGEPRGRATPLVPNNEDPGATLIHGDWDGDGTMDRGYYLHSGTFLTPGSAMQNVTDFGGFPTDQPVVGDWEGFGFDRPGIYRAHIATWHLDIGDPGYAGQDPRESGLQFGLPFEFPLVGDFHGEGRDRIAVYSAGSFRVDFGTIDGFDGPGAHPVEFIGLPFYGNPGDIPVIGNWDGDTTDDFAVMRTGNGSHAEAWWILDDAAKGAQGHEQYFAKQHGFVSDRPIIADFNGDGVSDLGVKDGPNGTGLFVQLR